MKPFSIGEYLKNPNRELITRGGRKARIICTDRKDADYPIVALVLNESETGEGTLYYTVQGKFYTTGGETPFDLFFAPEKHEGWINLYRNEDGISWISPNYFTSKKEVEKEGKTHTCSVTTIKIEWEE